MKLELSWTVRRNLIIGLSFTLPQQVVVTMDIWGAHCQGRIAQGQWNLEETKNSISWLELRAARLALQTFHRSLSQRHVLVRTDNMTTKAHISHQGGMRSLPRGLPTNGVD